MILHHKTVFPPDGNMVFAIHSLNQFIGVCLFKEGAWYVMPSRTELTDDVDFYWIEDKESKPSSAKG